MITMFSMLVVLLVSPAAAVSTPVLQVESPDFRVTKVQGQAPRARSEARTRKHGTAIVFLTKGTMRLLSPNGASTTWKYNVGDSFWRPEGSVDVLENTGKTPASYFEVEVKWRANAKRLVSFPPLDPVKIDPGHYRKLFENNQVRIVRALVPPGDKIPMHEHATNRAILFVTRHQVRVTDPAGISSEGDEPAETAKIGGACKHDEVSLARTLTDTIIVDLKALPE